MATGAETEPGQLLGAIFSGSPDAIVVVDAAGTIVLSSPAVTTLFGYYPEELLGASIEALLPLDRRAVHEHHLAGYFDAPHPRQMGVGLQLAGRDRNGNEFPVDVSLAPVMIRDGRYAAAFVRDASEADRAVRRLHAVNEVTKRLLGGATLDSVLPFVTRSARELSRSDAVWIVMPNAQGSLEIVAADGEGTGALVGLELAEATSRSAAVLATGETELMEDLSAAPTLGSAYGRLDLGPALLTALVGEDHLLGTLVFARTHGSSRFSDLDRAFAEVFASAITSAVELGEARRKVDQLSILAEDERIARDLHDTVIQQLFAIGLSLQATRATESGPIAERLDTAIDSIDDVIKQVRTTIFRLPGGDDRAGGLRDELLALAGRFDEETGVTPRVAFECPIDAVVPDDVAEQLLQVVTEGLSNVARHAHATHVEVVVTIEEGWLVACVVDDGAGFADEPSAGSGLRNMAQRAATLGGESRIRRRLPSGTIVEWRVPI